MSWISVKNRLPEDGQKVLATGLWFGEVSGPGQITTEAVEYIDPDMWYINGDTYTAELVEVTHWQPLPEPPND